MSMPDDDELGGIPADEMVSRRVAASSFLHGALVVLSGLSAEARQVAVDGLLAMLSDDVDQQRAGFAGFLRALDQFVANPDPAAGKQAATRAVAVLTTVAPQIMVQVQDALSEMADAARDNSQN